ncbi:MAG: hypothetical protein QM804_08435 [Propionicimonas sp.]
MSRFDGLRRATALATAGAMAGALLTVASPFLPPVQPTAAYAAPALLGCTPAESLATQRWWTFGTRGTLDFGVDGSAPVFAAGENVSVADEGTTTVSDVEGSLLFYSNGNDVWNAAGQVIEGGSGMGGWSSAVQTVAAFPVLGVLDTFYLVTVSSAQQVRYSVLDMSANGGLGKVTTAAQLLQGTASEALTSVPNADGTGFWALSFQKNSPNLLAWEFDGSGPKNGGTPVISTGPRNNGAGLGALSVYTTATQTLVAQADANYVRVFDFDAATGAFTLRYELNMPGGSAYFADFSPNGDYLYATQLGTSPLRRYDLTAGTNAQVNASIVDIAPRLGNSSFGQVRRGPDGRMYVAHRGAQALSIINNPNAADPANVGYAAGGLVIPSGARSEYGLPQLVSGCPKPPELQITKSFTPASPIADAKAGDTVTYSFEIRNTGISTVTDVGVKEVAANFTGSGPLPQATCPAAAASLGVNQTVICTADYTLTQADLDRGDLSNRATATATDQKGRPYESRPSNTVVTEFTATPGVKLTKTTEGAIPAQAGGTISYAFTVENTGNTTLSSVTVTEGDFTGSGTPPTVTCPSGAVAPGATVRCSAQYTVTQRDIDRGTINNSATATGTAVRGGDPTSDPNDPDSITETSFISTPGMKVDITTDKDRVTTPGEKIVFTFTVTNTGNLTITDPTVDVGEFTGRNGPLTIVCDDQPNPLPPGESLVCRAEYLAVEGDITGEPLKLTVVAGGLDPDGDAIPPATSEILELPTGTDDQPTRQLQFTKLADASSGTRPGDRVGYTIRATNVGEADFTATDPAELVDDLSGVLDDASYLDDATASVGTVVWQSPQLTWSGPLAAGQTVEIRYTVQLADEGTGDGAIVNRLGLPGAVDPDQDAPVCADTPAGNDGAPACQVELEVGTAPQPVLPVTGASLGLLGVALASVGVGILLVRRRRLNLS